MGTTVIIMLSAVNCLPIRRGTAWPQPQPPDTATFYITGDNFHIGILLPATDANRLFPMPYRFNTTTWVEYGWGDSAFFLQKDFNLKIAFKAIVGLGTSALRVQEFKNFSDATEGYKLRKFTVSHQALSALRNHIESTLLSTQDSCFAQVNSVRYFRAQGHYSLFNTCNSWVATGLRRAGITTAPYCGHAYFVWYSTK